MKAFQKDLEKFEKLNAQVLGVSDDDLETLEKFRDEHGITFPLIADDARKARKAYGWGRQTYLIDKKGIVRFMQKGVPDNELFLKELEKLDKE
ncbi:MAG: redoxin domain-containing protein [Deltaproteobacteria bacterium]|nr:redoxin domain-containing protein [Deltaproteobacteria bacterium]